MITGKPLLDGLPLSHYGLIFQPGHKHAMAPNTIERTLRIPGRPGIYDFGSDIDARYFELPLAFNENNRQALQVRIREFIRTLFDAYGKPKEIKLSFEEETDKYYIVKYAGSLVPEKLFGMGFFVLPLVAHDPHSRFVVPSDEITMDSDIPIMSDVLWGTGLSDFVITSPQTLSIINNGDLVIRLSYLLEGTGTNVTLSANGKIFSLGTFTNTNWNVNGDDWTIEKDGVTDLSAYTGDFIELLPGTNEVAFTGSNLNLTFSESMIYKYL